jgi:hypothetical protein
MNSAGNAVDNFLCIARLGPAGRGWLREWMCKHRQALSGGAGGFAWIVDQDMRAAGGQVAGITDPKKCQLRAKFLPSLYAKFWPDSRGIATGQGDG